MCCRSKLRVFAAAVVLVALWCLGAVAQPPLTITQSGYYLTQLDADGVPTLVQITTVVDLTGGSTPDAPEPPAPDVDAKIVKQVQGWAGTVSNPQGAQAIAAVYSHVRGAVEDGLLDETSVWVALKAATDYAINATEGGDSWDNFREHLSALVTEGRQRGTLQSSDEIARMMRSAQQGLELSADGSEAISLDLLVKIAAKTNEAIDASK